MRYICFLFLFSCISGCKYNNGITLVAANNHPEKGNSAAINASTVKSYEDGTYCATIKYYNPQTETNNICSLLIEVKDNQLTKINSSNCNWLNESNFLPKKFDEVGSVSFTGNKGNDYVITINEKSPLRSRKFQCDICGKELE